MQGKTILIVGGSRGIGAALAQKLLAEGAQVYNASRSATTLGQSLSYDALTDDPKALLAQLPDQLDGLVYCPGSINLRPFHRIKEEQFNQEFELNVMGAVRLLQAALPQLKKAEAGASVVLFSTVAVKLGMPFHSAIAMAKGALEGLTKSLAAEWASHNIRLNAIAPSLTNTDLAERLLNTEAKQESAAKRHPLGRIGQPQDIASLAYYLLDQNSQWMTGQVLGLDGGMGSLKI
ncbi:SDR family NAD(P)-dependent oxidoreductase [Saprospira sp. CCB-QB6]|uniref:SDR family NAD(P)-dependent oxidoreductase n=1 Tax=Saprospira sp. CCB-QB6 TaxID=3023936 RepID=UPI00234A406D|nr:SDR family oxidoreductase [Saprospira sp. CCB-QB6]WCL82993.1 SDR family NAD(P)-dependent oxidoreductase [Saprospira sp. CCB-QB6]